jgi:hypothetical protein
MYTEIAACRVCGSTELTPVLSLGEQYLTGVFPRSPDARITKGPLELVWCTGCSLLQLRHSYSLEEMYSENYGYRSGLNGSMVRHLEQKVRFLERLVRPAANDIVVDIGSNDATLLKAYEGPPRRLGIDPTGRKFRQFYTDDIALVADFFSAAAFEGVFPREKASIVTSIAMFYDLERPVNFVKDIARILAPEGIWHFEQSYMPSMLRTNSYDTICHEHLEFYSLSVVCRILAEAGLRVVDVEMNAVNGGSFAVTAAHDDSSHQSNRAMIDWMLRQEQLMGLDSPRPYQEFERRVFQHRTGLKELIESLVADGKRIVGYGASTKGNVLLQFCGFTTRHIECIAEVNEDKFGAFTPGTNIPIVPEKEARAMEPDYFLVLPWHFKSSILERERDYLARGGKFIFPMPEIEIV